ncbi:MAG: aminotransferase class V-fold PLP-dependent enzyme [Clostridia bacterium]|nr:aminotransferase class V-fold PLP-dependent enzyme [Clostridia bacterium]
MNKTKTPILDFLKAYDGANTLRLHMPGHKGKGILGVEGLDLTEISGADSLFEANGIIAESESNASKLFGVNTYYSTEGSSLAIRAMLYLCLKYAKQNDKKPFILAGRNAHKTFISALGLLDFDVKWLYSSSKQGYLACNITAKQIDNTLSKLKRKPVAVFLTSPDYLGNVLDIESISRVCKKHGVLLLVDCAHGSYLRFLNSSLFPTDLGADMCCSSAHKTLPVLTGGAYLHVKEELLNEIDSSPKTAMSLFSSTSPSYLIMSSLDSVNAYLSDDYSQKLQSVITEIDKLKRRLKKAGYCLVGNEPLKVTIKSKQYGYTGNKIAKILEKSNVFCEFSDEDFVVMMCSSQTEKEDIKRLGDILLNIKKQTPLIAQSFRVVKPKRKMSIRKAITSKTEILPVENCDGRVLANLNISCPPAVQIVCSGEVIDKQTIEVLLYYGIKECIVVK